MTPWLKMAKTAIDELAAIRQLLSELVEISKGPR